MNKFKVVNFSDVGRADVWLGLNNYLLPFTLDRADIGCRISVSTNGAVVLESVYDRDQRRTAPVPLPRGGDAVRLAAPWNWGNMPIGSIGIIDGDTDRDHSNSVSITFCFSAYVGAESAGVMASVSGGPGTIATPVEQLQLTSETISYPAWMWKDGYARADNAYHYTRRARLWEWTPDQAG
jgi:hypothetical protein